VSEMQVRGVRLTMMAWRRSLSAGLVMLGAAGVFSWGSVRPSMAAADPVSGMGSAATPRVLPGRLAEKLDGRLVSAALSDDPAPVAVWLTFTDKGEQGSADLLARLSAAEAALSDRARARRIRAHVSPLVSYDDLPVASDYLRALDARGLAVVASSRWLNRVAVRVPGAGLAAVAELPFVARIEPVARARRSAPLPAGDEFEIARPSPSSTVSPASPWASPARARASQSINYGLTTAMLKQMNVPAVHDSGYIGTGVLVCILDDGFNYHEKHEALRNVVIAPGRQRDFTQGDTIVTDTTSIVGLRHGTDTMGCIAANLIGTYVGSGYGAQYALARTEVDASETPVEMLYWGMGAEWADSLGADLITSSLGYFTFDNSANDYTYADMDGHTTDVTRAAEIAASKGILVCNAVGNEGNTTWHYLIAPADVFTDSLLAVGAVDQNGTVASFSSFGPNATGCFKPDVSARGVQDTLVSTGGNPNTYTTGSGTSFATPLVAGLAACLIQARPQWPPTQLARALRETASRGNNPDNHIGWGIPDGLAVLRLNPAVASVPPPSPRIGLRLLGSNPMSLRGAPLRVEFAPGEDYRPGTSVSVRVVDAQGREIRELYSGVPSCQCAVSMTWDGHTKNGAPAHPGIYLVAVESNGERQGARVILLP
jgi:serine protease AprX